MNQKPIADDRSEPSATPGLIGILFESFGGMLRLPRFDWRGRLLVLGLVAVAWASTAIYRVQPDEQGVVMRFGAPIYTAQAGLHVHWPYPIDIVQFSKAAKVNAIQRRDSPAVAAESGRERQAENPL
jgi:membrane protease subunit HflK